jgi:hypothetical protein
MTIERYWVVGGDYGCIGFKTLRDPQPIAVGPFTDPDEAKQVWERLSREHSSKATTRFSIAAERIQMPH